ncbi:Holliday junction resolvase RuvX [candidate division KSB1 bacterium]|nr:Holliday junction resolvase RuvX [candidate division KSB1 bacterium]MBL7094490.1 Holliday junction resolvase RuvX [candidate division KSB1 bacterium]
MTTNRILGIDFGEKRIGIAVSDPLMITAQPLPTLKIKNPAEIFIELGKIISEKNISEVVVGMPLNLKGQKGLTAKKVEEFIQKLKEKFHLPVLEWDERFTSFVAERIIKEMGKSPSRNKAKVDQISAVLILQGFLDHLKIANDKADS